MSAISATTPRALAAVADWRRRRARRFRSSEVAHISFSRGPAMIRDEDGALTGYVYLDLKTNDYGGFVHRAERAAEGEAHTARRLHLPLGRRV